MRKRGEFMNAVTKYCMLKLDCGQSDLAMLENVFSELAEDAYSKEWCVSTVDEVVAESFGDYQL